MPMIRVEMFKGRSDAQKRDMVRELTRAFVETAGGNAQAVEVMITEVDKGHWAAGGELYSDKFPD